MTILPWNIGASGLVSTVPGIWLGLGLFGVAPCCRLLSVFSLAGLNHGVWSPRGYGLVTTLGSPIMFLFQVVPKHWKFDKFPEIWWSEFFSNCQQDRYHDHKGGFPRQGTPRAGWPLWCPRCGKLGCLVCHGGRLGSQTPLKMKGLKINK